MSLDDKDKRIKHLENILQSEALLNTSLHRERMDLRYKMAKALEFMEDARASYHEHFSGCNIYMAFHPDGEVCDCGAARWENEFKKFFEDNKHFIEEAKKDGKGHERHKGISSTRTPNEPVWESPVQHEEGQSNSPGQFGC